MSFLVGGQAEVLERVRPALVAKRMIDRAYEPNFFIPLMAKDLGYARQAFAQAGIELASAEVARAPFVEAERAGMGQKDIAAIVELPRR